MCGKDQGTGLPGVRSAGAESRPSGRRYSTCREGEKATFTA